MDSFPTPASTQRSQIEIKRSRFITTIGNVPDKPAALLLIDKSRHEIPDANHHCWAMVAGRPDDIYQQDQSDDGEPKGTAGKPMLNVLRHSGLGNTVAVVTRYFGGIKLGSGGLVRAYTQSVTEPLKTLNTRITFIRTEVTIALPYTAFDRFEYWLQSSKIIVTDKQFQESIVMTLQAPESDIAALKQEVKRLNGSVIQSKA